VVKAELILLARDLPTVSQVPTRLQIFDGRRVLLAAELVGPLGSVLGIDRSAEAADRAGHRAMATGQHQVKFA
jgi:hypothetical protein